MDKILIIDHDPHTRNDLLREIRRYNKFRVLSTDSAETAAKIIISQKIDFLIVTLDLPDIDGFQLILHVKNHSPDTHSIAIADHFTQALIDRLQRNGVHDYFKKPVQATALIEKFFTPEDTKPPSSIYGITPASLLQLINFEQKTCTLLLSQNGYQGAIHCLNGETIGAQTGTLSGIKAFHQIIKWETPHIKMNDQCLNMEKQIRQPLMKLLMETHRMMDENPGKKAMPRPSAQKNKVSMHRSRNPQESCYDRKAFVHLEDKLMKISAIRDFEIMDAQNHVLNRRTIKKDPGRMSLQKFFSTGNELCEILGGRLKFASFTRSDRSSHFIAESKPFFIEARLKPGVKADQITL